MEDMNNEMSVQVPETETKESKVTEEQINKLIDEQIQKELEKRSKLEEKVKKSAEEQIEELKRQLALKDSISTAKDLLNRSGLSQDWMEILNITNPLGEAEIQTKIEAIKVKMEKAIAKEKIENTKLNAPKSGVGVNPTKDYSFINNPNLNQAEKLTLLIQKQSEENKGE